MITGSHKLIKQGYADVFSDKQEAYAERCLQFRVTFNDQAEACEAIRMIKSYNEFSGARVANKLAQVWDMLGCVTNLRIPQAIRLT